MGAIGPEQSGTDDVIPVSSCHYTGTKKFSIKMLNDVWMTVPKRRDTNVVYMQQYRGSDESDNKRNPKLKDIGKVMHVTIVACCVAAYILHLFLYFLALSCSKF